MKVAITGIGMISAAGRDVAETLEGFERGIRNAGPVSVFATDLPHLVFEVRTVPATPAGNDMRSLGFALCAVDEALRDAQLHSELSNFKVGVCMGTTVASQLNDIDFFHGYRRKEPMLMRPVDRYLKGNLADAVARVLGVRGPAVTVVNACSSGADAIGVALAWIRNRICDIAIAGGADELNPVPLSGFSVLGIMADSMCAPFDRDRKGLNLGEGAGVLILESEEASRKRGVPHLAYLSGYGSAADAYHLTAPDPHGAGLLASLQRAMTEATVASTDVCFVNAHGTATLDNDKIEASVLRRVFGQNVTFLSTKGFTGHTLGAAGALEAAFTVAALREGWIPPSAGFANQDDEILMSPVISKTAITGTFAISTSLGFGGNNAAIVIARRHDQ